MTLRVLGIDVTGPGGGAALLLPPGRVVTAAVPRTVRRGRTLVPLVRDLLAAEDLRPADLDLVACGVGPGSFTGIRIGIATAAALAYAAQRPVLDVGSMEGIAANAPADAAHVLVALDARLGRVFAARFRRDGDDLVLAGACGNVLPAEAVRDLPPETFVLGDGRRAHPDPLAAFPGTDHAPVRPDVVARLAARRFAAGERKAPGELRPLYLRLSDPEIRRAARDMP